MTTVEMINDELGNVDVDALIVGYFSDQDTPFASQISEATEDFVGNLLNNGEFDAKANEVVVLPYPTGLKANRLVLVGMGDSDEFDAKTAFQAAGSAAKSIAGKQLNEVALCFPVEHLEQAIAGVLVGTKGQDILRSEPKFYPFQSLLVANGNADLLEQGVIIGQSINTTRDLINQPPNLLYPESMAEIVQEVGDASGFEVEVWDEAKLKEERCNTLLAVARGSVKAPRMLILKHLGGEEGQPTLGLVGKGVTFDSGGYSLKPSDAMFDMKCDMGGAATVVGAMQAIAQLKLPINVVGYCGLVENLVSGDAFKLGDVITTRNGKTVEIHNTDAEGRLVLADVLDVAKNDGVDHLVDFATLTGACLVALGLDYAGLFPNDQQWCDQVKSAADVAGESCWQLPMSAEFSEQIKSNVADLKNMGAGRWGGSITAAKFLEEFVGDVPWVHVDIAGPAWSDTPKKWIDGGGQGSFVRALIELAKGYGK